MTNTIVPEAALAKAASRVLAKLNSQTKNQALEQIAVSIEESEDSLMAANAVDVQGARSQGASSSVALARLTLTPEKIQQMAVGVRAVASLKDPVGQIRLQSQLDDGLELKRITCPFGVIAAVVEARPDAIVQLAALALKSGNTLMIKAGTEVGRTAKAIHACFATAFASGGQLPPETITNVKDREALHELLALPEYVDLIVPRGGAELIRFITANTRIPVLGHADGVCHIYVDRNADLNMAFSLILDSKLQAPGTCNAVETVLVDRHAAREFLPRLVDALQLGGVRVRGCEVTGSLCAGIDLVSDSEWHTEYGGLVLALKVVDGCEEAIAHINHYGSHHTDCIVTDDLATAEHFLQDVDSAGVFHNASTRFSDGYRYGFGAEVGISTGKLHARGPVGLDGLVTYKYVLSGNGQCVSQYVGPSARRFRHELSHALMESC